MSDFNVSGVYKILNIANGKFYVGSAVNILKRWSLHLHYLRHNKHHSQHFQRAFRKYGEHVFCLELLEITTPTRSELLEREQFYLDTLQPFKNSGYNICRKAGSALGVKRSAASRRKLSKACQGRVPWNKGKNRPPFSEEWKRKLGRSGESNAFYGKRHSDKTKSIIAHKTKERMSDPTQNYFYGKSLTGSSNGMFGKTHSAATRKLLGANRGRKFSEESRRLMSLARKGKPLKKAVIQKDLDGRFIARFPSIAEAARFIGTSISNLKCCVHGRSQTAKGFRWEIAAA